jgi:predicted  nucleic acid-binding Zn-ribbon protein
MMAVEEAEKKVKSADAALKDAEQTVAADRKEIENRARGTNRKMLADISGREKLAAQVPEEILDRYSRLAKRHHGVALAEAAHEQCYGCGMRILPHTYQELHRFENRDLHFCENCGRILYTAEFAPVITPSAASAS